MKENKLVYCVGDLVADPITNTLGVITEVFEKYHKVEYKVYWTNQQKYNKRLYDHYELCLLEVASE
jgi:hypothetical protein